MATIFGLFAQYDAANAAVETLQSSGFDMAEINVIVQEGVVRNELDGALGSANTAVTDDVGDQTLFGLDKIIGGHQPMVAAGIGDAYAVGSIATTMIKTASANGAVEGDLQAAMVDFGIAQEAAEAYTDGLASGRLLLLLKVDDANAAKVAEILRDHKATHVADHTNY